jgi:predicted Fe-Mo cluster-binding NifX family protein
MKLGFPLIDDSCLAQDFAHSKFIGIFDANTGKKTILAQGDTLIAEKSVFESLVYNQLTMVISPFYSFLSLRVFKENKIVTYKAVDKTMEDNIERFQSGKMKPFNVYESLLTGKCAKDCVKCTPDNNCEVSTD